MIYHEGMPHVRNPMEKGLLIIQFDVIFPKNNSLTKNQIEQLKSILPSTSKELPIPDDYEEVELRPCDQEFVQRQSQNNNQDDEDDEDEPGFHHRGGGHASHVQQCTTG